MKSVIALLALGFFLAGAAAWERPPGVLQDPAPAPVPADLGGIYHVRGSEEDKAYWGTCVVTQVGDVLIFNYAMEGGTQSVGLGIRDGRHIAIAWQSGALRGVTQYKLDGKNMSGTWSPIPADMRKRSESLRYLRPIADKED